MVNGSGAGGSGGGFGHDSAQSTQAQARVLFWNLIQRRVNAGDRKTMHVFLKYPSSHTCDLTPEHNTYINCFIARHDAWIVGNESVVRIRIRHGHIVYVKRHIGILVGTSHEVEPLFRTASGSAPITAHQIHCQLACRRHRYLRLRNEPFKLK